ncbi:MAG TPA: polysaccharide deacetylase family protein [Polyangiaceae bacterium]|nr:polysaccharide deacetylase family protein [Polyangiaceae bacterium]
MTTHPSFSWPRGARAAVSLTYDDAVPTQRRAASELERHGLRGTFFLTGSAPDLGASRARWRRLIEAGHELASHTMHHPCDCSHAWVPRGYTTQDYDLSRMGRELDETLELLAALGAPPPYTFAYPCGETRVGTPPASYVPLVAERFLAARGVEPRIADPWRDPLELVPAHDGAKSPEELVALVDRAVNEGGWLVLLFHGVGGDHLPVDAKAHHALAEHLARRSDAVWTESFGGVAAHVRQQRASAAG